MDYATILTINYPNSEWYLNGDDYSGLTWLSSDKKPTKKELDDQREAVMKKIEDTQLAKKAARLAILEKLGLTEDDIGILFQ